MFGNFCITCIWMSTKTAGLCSNKKFGVILRNSERTVVLVNDIHMNSSCRVVHQLDWWSLLVASQMSGHLFGWGEDSSGFLVMRLWMLFCIDTLDHGVTHYISFQCWRLRVCDTDCWCLWHLTGLWRIRNFFKLSWELQIVLSIYFHLSYFLRVLFWQVLLNLEGMFITFTA